MKLRTKLYNMYQAQRIGKDALLKLFRIILVTRLLDQRLVKAYRAGEIQRILHSGKYEEVGPAAVALSLQLQDKIIPHYRGFSALIAKGLSLEKIVAEVYGKADGPAQGKGGQGKFVSLEEGIYSHSGILGCNLGMAVGMAFTSQYQNANWIAVVFFGDGSTNRGPFYTALNLSALWSLPLLFVCENNQYTVSKRFEDTSITSLQKKVEAFGIHYQSASGRDALEALRYADRAVRFVREKRKPMFLEFKGYRSAGHSVDDKADYQSQNEQKIWNALDPLENLAEVLLDTRMCADKEFVIFREQANANLEHAFFSARKGRSLNPEMLIPQLYAESIDS